MSVENVTKFYNEVLQDEELKEKLSDVNEKTLTEEVFESRVLPEAKAKGLDFTYEDAKEYYKQQGEKTELNLDEMENVAGGGNCRDDVSNYRYAQVGPNDNCSEPGYFLARDPNGEKICKNCNCYQPFKGYHYCSAKAN